MTKEIMNDRLLVRMVRDICSRREIELTSRSDDWLLELSKGGRTRRIIGYRFDVNNAVASQIAQDKVATHMVLAAKNIPSVQHAVVRGHIPETDKAMMSSWGKIVAKPLTGSGGSEVRLFGDVEQLSTFVGSSPIRAWAVAPWVPIDNETRIILLDGKVMLAYAKQPIEVNGMKMFNLSLGGHVLDIEITAEQKEIAKRAQAAVGLRLCAVDIVNGEHLESQVLEVNDAFGMEHYGRVSDSHYERAMGVYEHIIDSMFA